MPRKVILIADPGIDTAFAIALALHDPALDVVGLIPCAGNVSAEQATSNVHILIDQLDPPRWPRTAAALHVEYEMDGLALHGPGGLGGVHFPITTKHQQPAAERAIIELVHMHPREITILCIGPVTTLSAAFKRDPELPSLIDRVVLVGGCYRDSGNAGPVSEFHFWLDPDAVRHVIRSEIHPMIIPVDVTRKLMLSPSELLELPNPGSRTCQFLRQVVPYGIRASSNIYGVEGFHLKDVLGVAALALPGCISTEPRYVDIETKGELTRGMTVVDDRKTTRSLPNAHMAMGVALGEVRQWIDRILRQSP